MLKINLLPDSAKQASLSRVEQFHRTPLMALAVGVLLAIPLVLWIPIHMRRQQLSELNAKIQLLEPRRNEVEQLQKLLHELREQETAFQSMANGTGQWSRRFNILSNVTPDGIWFTELALDQSKGLIIQGSAIAEADPEMASVPRLVQGLKADRDFMSAIKDIQIESIKRVQDESVELVQFTLTCSLVDRSTL